MAVLVPQIVDRKWGRDWHQRFDYLQHPTRDPGGNPVLLYRHPGGGNSGTKGSVWTVNQGANGFANYLANVRTAAGDTHFDFASIEFAQARLDAVEGKGKVLLFPEVIVEAQRAVIGFKQQIQALGGDPSRIVVMGECHGAYQWLLACCFMSPSASSTGGLLENRRIYSSRYWDSRVRGVINYAGNPLDLRRRLQTNVDPGFGIFAGATWTEATKKITKIGAFAHYDFVAGDACVIASGTNATPGQYAVASKIDADNITLTTSVGATASNLSGYTSCEVYDPSQSNAYFGTNQAVNFNEWYGVPQSMKTAASALAYAQAGQLSFYVPVIHIYEDAGTHSIPYGNLFTVGSDGHDIQQGTDLRTALAARGIETQMIPVDRALHPWKDDAYSNANYSQPLYDFAVQCITSAP